MTKRESKIAQIAKLQALAEHPSTDPMEAESAMRMARSIMVKHAIEQADIAAAGGKAEKIVHREFTLRQRFTWHRNLAHKIALYLNCSTFFLSSYKGWDGSFKQQRIVIVGFEGDAEIAEYLYHSVAGQLEGMSKAWIRRIRRYDKTIESGDAASRRIGYLNAAVIQIGRRLREMARASEAEVKQADEAANTSTALVIMSRREKVTEHLATLNLRTASYTSKNYDRAGRDAGDRVNIQDAIDGPRAGTKQVG